MKLYTSTTSPFARKVLVLARELGLDGAIDLAPVALTPTAPSAELSGRNPLGKIPALELSDGTVLYDSRVICEYLDGIHSGPRRVPESGPARFRVLRTQALADGILDAGILIRYERALRPGDKRWDGWIDAQAVKVLAGLDALEGEVDGFGDLFDLGQIATACALGWLEFRKPLLTPDGPVDMRARSPKLFAAYDRWLARPSLGSTLPG